MQDLSCVRLPALALAATLAAGLTAGCGGTGGNSAADAATGRILVSVMAQAENQTKDCANPGIAGAPETGGPTYRMPPDCKRPISVSEIDVSALAAIRSSPDVDISTLRIQALGNGGIKFSLKSPSGRLCVAGAGFAADTC